MPKVTIDGVALDVPSGTTILEAALSQGREIPHYCWHPGLSVAGNCRMCLVEVEKAPKLLIGCYTPVAEGMVVHTASAKVKQARSALMEFFLINHPLDCPICDQAGECKLQEFAVEHGDGRSRYTEAKLALSKAVDIGTHVMLDQERCIQCSRCIRFCDEVTHTGELRFFQRGERSQIGIYPGRPLANAYSGNVVDLCPVGALTLKEFRFRTRVWYLKNTPTICAGCARGCNVVVATGQQETLMATSGQQDGRIKRIVPRVNEAVNGHWICDDGRLSYRRQEAATPLRTAEAPAGTPAAWDDAVVKAAAILDAASKAGRLGVIASPRATCEDLYAWRRLAGATARLGVHAIVAGADDRILIRADKGANSTGARFIWGEGKTASSVLEAAARGEIDALVVLGDPLDPADTVSLPSGARAKVKHLVYAGPFVAPAAAGADVALPTAAWAEEDGTWVNFEGRVQRVRRAHPARDEGRPGWRVVCDLAAAMGVAFPSWTDSDEVFAAMAGSVREMSGLDPKAIGFLGVVAAAPART